MTNHPVHSAPPSAQLGTDEPPKRVLTTAGHWFAWGVFIIGAGLPCWVALSIFENLDSGSPIWLASLMGFVMVIALGVLAVVVLAKPRSMTWFVEDAPPRTTEETEKQDLKSFDLLSTTFVVLPLLYLNGLLLDSKPDIQRYIEHTDAQLLAPNASALDSIKLYGPTLPAILFVIWFMIGCVKGIMRKHAHTKRKLDPDQSIQSQAIRRSLRLFPLILIVGVSTFYTITLIEYLF